VKGRAFEPNGLHFHLLNSFNDSRCAFDGFTYDAGATGLDDILCDLRLTRKMSFTRNLRMLDVSVTTDQGAESLYVRKLFADFLCNARYLRHLTLSAQDPRPETFYGTTYFKAFAVQIRMPSIREAKFCEIYADPDDVMLLCKAHERTLQHISVILGPEQRSRGLDRARVEKVRAKISRALHPSAVRVDIR